MKAEIWKCWLSCRQFTIQTNTDSHGTIVWTAPITRRFLGQPLGNLVAWMRTIGNFQFLGRLELREHFLRGLPARADKEILRQIDQDARMLYERQDEWGRLFIHPESEQKVRD